MRMRQHVILLICATGLIFAGVFYWQKSANEPAAVIACTDITQGCGNQQLQVKFDHKPQVMRPFTLSVNMPHVTELHASFAMQGMLMGLNRYRLLPQPDGGWQANVILPACIQGRSDWDMLIEARTAAGLVRYTLPFKAEPR
jgi:hypothetical protein